MTRLFLFCLATVLAVGWFLAPVAVRAQEAELPAPDDQSQWIAVARGTVDAEAGLMRLAAEREGLIAEVMVEEGDHVTAGQPLLRIDDKVPRLQMELAEGEVTQSQTQVELARLRSVNADAEVKRLRPLARADALPRRQLDEAERAAALAKLEVTAAEQTLVLQQKRIEAQRQEVEARIVRAPVDGVILRRSARPGGGTTTQTVTEMFLLAPDGPRVVRAQLDEQFVDLVKAGQKAELVRERDDSIKLEGHVIRVAPVFGSAQSSSGATAGSGGGGSEPSRTVDITVMLDGPQAEVDRLVLGQRMIARIMR